MGVEELIETPMMGAFYGPAGTGKTFALTSVACSLEDVVVAWVEFESRPTTLHVATRLYEVLVGEAPHRLRRNLISPQLIETLSRLSDRRLLLVVDEAQRLNRECFEYLRYLHDHTRTGFALAFAGGNGCWEVLSAEPMLLSRIYRTVAFGPMTDSEVRELVPAYHPMFADVEEEVLDQIDRRVCKGVLRNWAAFTKTAETTMERTGATELTHSVVDLSIARLPPIG